MNDIRSLQRSEGEPDTVADRVTDAAMDAAQEAAEEHDAEIEYVVVLVRLARTPDGWTHSVGSSGFEEDGQLLDIMLDHTKAVAQSMGVGMAIVPVAGEG